MSSIEYNNGVVPITDKDLVMPQWLWDPSYTDKRFVQGTSDGLTIFADPSIELTATITGGEMDRSLCYDYSDRIASFVGSEALKAAKNDAEEAAGNNRSARYLEFFLRNAYEDQGLWLGHVKAGVNISNGESYKLYGYKFS